VALLFYLLMPETKPEPHPDHRHETLFGTFRHYHVVLRDHAFVAFLVACILMGIVYIQMYNSLSVYLRDYHGIQPQAYGFLLTSSAITVIAFQISVMRVIKTRPPFVMMSLGTLFYMIGFGMFAIVSAYGLFVLAVVIITVGEMIVVPTSQALAANFARVDMRGRYMAVFDLTNKVPATVGPAAAGVVLDNYDPNLVWHLGSVLCAISAVCFYVLHARLGSHTRFDVATQGPDAAQPAMEA